MCDQQVAYRIVFASGHAGDAAPTAALRAVGAGRQAFDVAFLRQRYHNLVIADQVFVAKLARFRFAEIGAALIAIFLLQLLKIGFDELANLANIGQQHVIVVDVLKYIAQFLFHFAAFQRRKASQAHI